jgi:hypothetical protein
MIFVALLLIGLLLLYTTHYWFNTATIMGEEKLPPPKLKHGPICGFMNIPLPTHAMANTPYWCHSI